jgi:hypothetical protein
MWNYLLWVLKVLIMSYVTAVYEEGLVTPDIFITGDRDCQMHTIQGRRASLWTL